MTTRIDHAAKANTILNNIRPDEIADVETPNWFAWAQVHATLALVEQQRIANVIALMQMQVECDEKTEELAAEAMLGLVAYERTPATPLGGPDEVLVMRPDIREALGL